MNKFIPGLKLSEVFFKKAVQPIMQEKFPQLSYAAARLDYGSDILGFDTAMSMDHGWGPRLTLYLSEDQFAAYDNQLIEYFSNHLPFEILGFPTNFAEPLSDGGVMSKKTSYPIHHMISISTPQRWFSDYLGVDMLEVLDPKSWLTIPQQRLATVKNGRIFYDGTGILTEYQKKLSWYPHDLWLYLMANQWRRIDQDEPFVGRTGGVGDDLGSKLIAARLVQDLMHLGFLMNKTYAPYRKWFGSAYKHLSISNKTIPLFQKILRSENRHEREEYLNKTYILFGEELNNLGLTPYIKPEVSKFYNRPFLVPHAARFAEALLERIKDPEVQKLPPNIGSIDQICDNTDILENIEHTAKLHVLYEC